MSQRNEPRSFSTDEFMQMGRALERHHQIFHQFWQIGKPIFTNEVKTAAVSMEEGGVRMMINPEFWKSQTEYQKEFVICHECLHPLLKHGIRGANIPQGSETLANKAMDVCVNHALVNSFGFQRELVDPENKYCWTNTVFPDEKIEDNKSFEFYFGKLLEKNESGGETLDSHDGLGSLGDFDFDKFKETCAGSMSDDEAKVIRDFFGEQDKEDKEGQANREGKEAEAGDGTGDWFDIYIPKQIPPKKKWETVIEKWSLRKIIDGEDEHWACRPRRLETFGGNFFLPSELEIETFKADMIQLFFFLDVSGSCISYAERFSKAARSLPKDRFKARLFCFDTVVKEIDMNSRIYGGGGTRFDILEEKIQQIMREERVAYPKAVFVITDGYGNDICPEKPEVWHWFLTNDCSLGNIPAMSHTHNMRDFE